MSTKPILRVPRGLAERIQAILHPQPFHERFAFAVARPLRSDTSYACSALLEQLVFLDAEDYERSSSASLILTDGASSRVNR